MEKAISAADANRNFSSILRSVREGQSFVVTSHGRPVARIIPADTLDDTASAGRAALFARLKRQPVTDIGRWTRDELYEDEK
jgi:prevent-host-death family protein